MKEGIENWRRSRAELFEHKKKKRVLERVHKNGVVDIDSALRPGTELYAEQREVFEAQARTAEIHRAGRSAHLADQTKADDSVAGRNYGEAYSPACRGADIPLQRKRVDPDLHPFRFLNTYK